MKNRRFNLLYCFSMIFLIVFCLPFCAKSETIKLYMEGMNQFHGKALRARLIDKSSGREVKKYFLHSLSNRDYTIFFRNLNRGANYYLDIFIDINNNNAYEPEIDPSWRINIDNINSKEMVSFSPDLKKTIISWTRQNDEYTIRIHDLKKYINKYVNLRIIQPAIVDEMSEIGYSTKRIDSDEMDISVQNELSDKTTGAMIIEYYIDNNQNGNYDINEDGWRVIHNNKNNNIIIINDKTLKRKL